MFAHCAVSIDEIKIMNILLQKGATACLQSVQAIATQIAEANEISQKHRTAGLAQVLATSTQHQMLQSLESSTRELQLAITGWIRSSQSGTVSANSASSSLDPAAASSDTSIISLPRRFIDPPAAAAPLRLTFESHSKVTHVNQINRHDLQLVR